MASITQHAVEAGSATMQTNTAYVATTVSGTAAVLTHYQVIGVIGLVISLALAGFTAWSSHKKNKAIIASLKKES